MRNGKGKIKKGSGALPDIGEFTPQKAGKIDTKKDALIEETEQHPNWHWDKHEIESPTSAALIDPESGKQVMMRRFLLTVPKEYEVAEDSFGKKRVPKAPPDNEEIIAFHRRAMLDNLARDGWEPFEEPTIGRVRWSSLSIEDRATLDTVVMHNWIYAVMWRCYAAYGVIREATHQEPHSVTALMNEAAKRQSQSPTPTH